MASEKGSKLWTAYVNVMQANGLGSSSINAHVEVSILEHSEKTTIKPGADPEWKEKFKFYLGAVSEGEPVMLKLEVLNGAESLGVVNVKISGLIKNGLYTARQIYPLANTGSKKASGSLEVGLKLEHTHEQKGYSQLPEIEAQPLDPLQGKNFPLGYVGPMGREAAVKMLEGRNIKTFLLRYSNTSSSYVLSYVAKNKQVAHIAYIQATAGGVTVDTKEGRETFPHMHAFIETMKKNEVIMESVSDQAYIHTDQA